MILAGFVIALGAIVDDAIIDVENIVRRLRLAAAQGSDAVRRRRSSWSLARGARRDRLRDAHRGAGAAAGLLPGGPDRRVLPAAGHLLRAGGPGLAGGRADRDAGAVADPVAPGTLRSRASRPLVRWLQARLRGGSCGRSSANPIPAFAVVGVIVRGRRRRRAPARPVAAARLQGARLPDALGDQAGHVAGRRRSASRPQPAKELRAIPGVRNFGAHIGQALVSRRGRSASTSARTGSASTRRRTTTRPLARIQEVVDGYPGLHRDVQTYLKERIREVLTGAGEAIVVRIYGDDLDVLREKADEVEELLHRRRRPGRGARRAARRRSPRSTSRSTWPRPSATASSRATCAGRRRR